MRIIPVMDLKAGQVVHAVGGRRHEYKPIRSVLVDSARPEIVARAFRDELGLDELYVADLDALAGLEPHWAEMRSLAQLGLKLLVDAGVRDTAVAVALNEAGVDGIVVGLETVSGADLVRSMVQTLGAQSLWFSLDLKDGQPLGNLRGWSDPAPESIADQVIAMGLTRLIVLDLARVGEHRGTGTEALCRLLRQRHHSVELVAGGGVRGESDLQRLEAIGVSAVLVASALHNGTIGANRIAPTGRSSPPPRS